MLEYSTTIWISIGLFVYFVILQVFSNFMRSGMKTNTPNKEISRLRSEYKVNIRTFQKNNNLHGFAWIRSIWINENLFKKRKALLFTFFHELYHLKHKHKQKVLLMRFVFSLLPVCMVFMHWMIFIPCFIGVASLIQHIQNIFEEKANNYANKMTANENVRTKGKKSSK